jgi:hypothetical protein
MPSQAIRQGSSNAHHAANLIAVARRIADEDVLNSIVGVAGDGYCLVPRRLN